MFTPSFTPRCHGRNTEQPSGVLLPVDLLRGQRSPCTGPQIFHNEQSAWPTSPGQGHYYTEQQHICPLPGKSRSLCVPRMLATNAPSRDSLEPRLSEPLLTGHSQDGEPLGSCLPTTLTLHFYLAGFL